MDYIKRMGEMYNFNSNYEMHLQNSFYICIDTVVKEESSTSNKAVDIGSDEYQCIEAPSIICLFEYVLRSVYIYMYG